MYRILIADDNPLIRMGLVNMIRWDELPVELAGTAENGQEALRLCEEKKADILITDIKMPKKDGLYLMKELQEKYPLMQIIVVSAYDDFSYAKEAMKAGSLNYILKPVNPEELMETIKKAAAILDEKETQDAQDNILEHFTYGGGTGYKEAGREQEREAAGMAASDGMKESMRLFYSSAQGEKLLGLLSERMKKCGKGEKEKLVENQKMVEGYLRILITFSPAFLDQIRLLLACVEGKRVGITFENCEELLEKIGKIVNEMCQAVEAEDDNGKKIAYALKRVIDHNYSSEISLESLAEMFNYTPDYLGKVFKKEMGCNLTKYVNDVRIEEAKRQLLQSGKKIMRIAEDVGFRDYIYFTKQFKKYTGYTPGSFRKKKIKEE